MYVPIVRISRWQLADAYGRVRLHSSREHTGLCIFLSLRKQKVKGRWHNPAARREAALSRITLGEKRGCSEAAGYLRSDSFIKTV